jgi:hypothetical protein
MIRLKETTCLKISTIILFVVQGFVFQAKGYVVPDKIEACGGDTIYIPVYIDSINNYELINSYHFKYGFEYVNMNFIGVDSSRTIIPPNGLDIILNDLGTGVIYVEIEGDNNDQTFYELNNNATKLVTLRFTSNKGFEDRNFGYLSVESNTTNAIEKYYSIRTIINVFANVLEISDNLISEKEGLIVSATAGYNDYKWTYEKFSDLDYVFGDLMYEGSTASFNGNGLYTVSAVDEHGCKLSDEKYIESGGAFAKGTVIADGKPYTEGTVAAYLKTGEGFVLEHQRNIEDGAFLFPSTLSSGEYKFCAVPEENSGYQATYYGNKPTIENAFTINLSDHEGVVGLNINLLTEEKEKSKSASSTLAYDFQIYPNPVRDNLNIQISSDNLKSQEILVVVSNINGEIFYRKKLWFTGGEANLGIDSSNFPQGTCAVKIGGLSRLFLKR